jgi:hypothetical protein
MPDGGDGDTGGDGWHTPSFGMMRKGRHSLSGSPSDTSGQPRPSRG